MYATQLKNITTKHDFLDWCIDIDESSAFKRRINSTEYRVSQCVYGTCLLADFKHHKFNLCYYTGNYIFSSLCHILCAYMQDKTADEIQNINLENFKDILNFYTVENKIAFQRILNHTKILARKLTM
jgi:sulfur transfer protein SufE